MKKLIVAVLSFASISAVAGTSATLTLQGSIAPILDIAIEQDTLATNLPLDQAINNQRVGMVIESSNNSAGYTISVSSQNGGRLVRDSDNSVTYQLSYDNNDINLNAPSTVVSTNSQQGQFERDLKISYSRPSEYLASGDYTDIVTFTITAE